MPTDFADFFKNARLQKAGNFFVLGEMPNAWITALEKNGVFLKSQKIIIRDADIQHALRDSKKKSGTMLPPEFWENLVNFWKTPDFLFLEKTKNNPALFLIFGKSQKVSKVVLLLNYNLMKKEFANVVRTGKIVDFQNVHNEILIA